MTDMTDAEIIEEINRLRAEREELAERIGELSTELLNRYPPAQVGIPPISLYGGW